MGNGFNENIVSVNMIIKLSAKQLLITGILILACAFALACDVPVFSYAIQHWESDSYIVHVFHHGALTSGDQLMLSLLNDAAADTMSLNIVVHTVDLEQPQEAGLLELYANHLEGVSPGLLMHYPATARIQRPVHAGALDETGIRRLVDSPARREIVKRLLRGDMAVWVLLESGNRREDNQAARTLEAELARMAKVLQLPTKDRWAWSEDIDAEAGVRFSMLRVSRAAPEEEMLVRMLVKSEPDLAERAASPMAFPVYGRGLILYALVGAGINEWTIADACEFVIGPCSCQVKAANPGTDLLLAMDWDRFIRSDTYSGLPAAAGLADFFERGEEAAARLAALGTPDINDSGSTVVEPSEQNAKRSSWLYAVIAVPLALLFLGCVQGLRWLAGRYQMRHNID